MISGPSICNFPGQGPYSSSGACEFYAYQDINIEQPVANFNDQVTLRGQTGNGLDAVVLTIGGSAYAVVAPSLLTELPQVWKHVEFNVYGAGGYSEANFNDGSILTVRTAVNNGTTDLLSSLSGTGTKLTGESNNLFINTSNPLVNLTGVCYYNGAQPSFAFVESTSTGTTIPCSSLGDNAITLSIGPGGTISPSAAPLTAIHVPNGVISTFKVIPISGYQISSVMGCGGILNGNIFTTAPASADCTISVIFTPLPTTQTHTVTVSQDANGAINPTAGSYAVTPGANVWFTLTPSPGYALTSVGGTCGGTLVNNMSIMGLIPFNVDGSFIFATNPVTTNCTVIPAFAPSSSANKYSIQTNAVAGGTITPKLSSMYLTAPAGMSESFIITPNAGNSISSVTGCGSSDSSNIYTSAPIPIMGSSSSRIYTTAPITASCTITATFASDASPLH
ncbi:MAG: hypothetical protein LBU72_01680 [Burkholderiaceae bacterium]|nr:hypothetical protein [Burkholderiaceae bacterium]